MTKFGGVWSTLNWTLNLGPPMVYLKALFPPNFIIKVSITTSLNRRPTAAKMLHKGSFIWCDS